MQHAAGTLDLGLGTFAGDGLVDQFALDTATGQLVAQPARAETRGLAAHEGFRERLSDCSPSSPMRAMTASTSSASPCAASLRASSARE